MSYDDELETDWVAEWREMMCKKTLMMEIYTTVMSEYCLIDADTNPCRGCLYAQR